MATFSSCESGAESDCPEVSNEVEVPQSRSFVVGETFRSFEEVENRIKEYEKANYVQFWKRDARTVKNAQKRLNRPLHDRIKYYEITFCCIHGGKRFTSKGEGKRSCL